MVTTLEELSPFLDNINTEWNPLLFPALKALDSNYLEQLSHIDSYLPKRENIFAAFRLPLQQVHYVLLGESPYPRPASANGFAFWDNAVNALWSETGFSKPVNRATSLRNWLKALLHARGDLTDNFSQMAISELDKSAYHQTASDFFNGIMAKGFLLLNASLIYEPGKVNYHAKQWKPFMQVFLQKLAAHSPHIKLVLFGNIAKAIDIPAGLSCVIAEHPYNISFITNPTVLNFFRPLDLLNHYPVHD